MEANPKGRKRPVLIGPNGKMTPVPWVGGDYPQEGNWAKVDHYRASEAEESLLCIVCGQPLSKDFVYALLNGRAYNGAEFLGSPSPTYGHPECILKACLFCPHLQKQQYPAMTNDKIDLTLNDLKRLVQDKKKALMSKDN
jgi:hypothetical protein